MFFSSIEQRLNSYTLKAGGPSTFQGKYFSAILALFGLGIPNAAYRKYVAMVEDNNIDILEVSKKKIPRIRVLYPPHLSTQPLRSLNSF